jgi:endonuclease V-like protein UPF0215 family
VDKKLYRILGIDDGRFSRNNDSLAPLIGLIYRADGLIEKIYRKDILVDGTDVSDSIVEIIRDYGGTIASVISEGITFAGFNIPNIDYIYNKAGVPFISYLNRKPSISSMEKAMRKHSLYQNIELLKKLDLKETNLNGKTVWLNFCGISLQEALSILYKATITGRRIEPVRLADMIGRII